MECDKHPQTAREKLERLLGPATVVVESGGEWVDTSTGEVQAKLHLHWLLAKPVTDKAGFADLKNARDIATRLAGGDPSNVPMVHPIRWPGSVHRKGEPKLCTIAALNADRKIDLDAALNTLRKAAPAAKEKANGSDKNKNWAEQYGDEGRENELGRADRGGSLGENYHNALVRLASMMITAGMHPGAAVNALRGLMKASSGPHDQRWKDRFDDIPRAVSSAEEKFGQQQEQEREPSTAKSAKQTTQARSIPPVDLWAQATAPELPKGLLPREIEEFAFEQGRLMGADPAGLAMGALTVCSAVIPDCIQIQPKRNDRGWKESTRQWTALVGNVSALKTPIMNKVMRAVEHIDAEARRKFARKKAEYEALPAEERKDEAKPALERIRIEDITPEAAQEVFRNNDDGVLLSRDELSGWFGSMDKYAGHRGAAADRGFWLQAFNGGSYTVDRVGRGSGTIEHLSISIVGGIQPDAIRKLAADGVDDELHAADQSDHVAKRRAGIGGRNGDEILYSDQPL